jgi:hypothetical protein
MRSAVLPGSNPTPTIKVSPLIPTIRSAPACSSRLAVKASAYYLGIDFGTSGARATVIDGGLQGLTVCVWGGD